MSASIEKQLRAALYEVLHPKDDHCLCKRFTTVSILLDRNRYDELCRLAERGPREAWQDEDKPTGKAWRMPKESSDAK